MIVSVNQPYFFPFAGFFHKAHLSDFFIILDSVQFPRGSTWITRNRFKHEQGSLWLRVPVKKKGLGLQIINAVKIYHDDHWEKKHLSSLKHAYQRSPYYQDHIGFLENLYSSNFDNLVDLNLEIIHYLMQCLRIDTNVLLLSELEIHTKGTRLLIEICQKMGASQFLAQRAAIKYFDHDKFKEAKIGLLNLKLPAPVYPQLWGDFIPNLSVLDLIFNCGPKAHDMVIEGR